MARFDFKQIRLLQLTGHTAGVRSIHVMDNELGVITAGRDKTARVWSLHSQVRSTQFQFLSLPSHLPSPFIGDRKDSTFGGTVKSGYVIQGMYHPTAYIGHFRPEPNFYMIKPPGISSSLPVTSATLRGARGYICALRAAQIALIAGVAA